MPLQIDTLTTINSRVQGDINGNVDGADSRLRRNVLGVIAYMLARLSWGWYRFLAYVARQRLPDTMDDDNLANFGGLFGVPPTGVQFAGGTATVSGAAFAAIAQGTVLQTQSLVEYIVQGAVELDNTGNGTVALLAAVAGSAGNQIAGTQLTFVSPVAGVNAGALVVGMAGGLDVEDPDNYRGRIVDHLQSPPQGGTAMDYVQWARSMAGVTRAWCTPNYMGAGTVGVFFVFDGRANIFPLTADVAAMQALLNSKAPSTDTPYAVAPVANPLALTIALNPSSAATQAAIAAELADLVAREGAPGATTLYSHIDEAVGLGAGSGDYIMSVPAYGTNFTNTAVQITTVGVITWAAWP
jgi:uncharacterized phage protein gp47/JayE